MKTTLSVTDIAHICHDANRALCRVLGDNSQAQWEDCPEWQRESAVKGVGAVIADPSITPDELHQKWCLAKKEDGWVYGDVKDADRKTHPCLVPYSQLPAEQQYKDELFRGIVLGLGVDACDTDGSGGLFSDLADAASQKAQSELTDQGQCTFDPKGKFCECKCVWGKMSDTCYYHKE